MSSPLEFAPVLSKAARRRSLPARTSMASLASVASISSLLTSTPAMNAYPGEGVSAASSPDAGTGTKEFQTRRRRAAKLTQFFGVDYRDLIEDVLESIEHGLDAERKRGTLNQQEAEVRFVSFYFLFFLFGFVPFLLFVYLLSILFSPVLFAFVTAFRGVFCLFFLLCFCSALFCSFLPLSFRVPTLSC